MAGQADDSELTLEQINRLDDRISQYRKAYDERVFVLTRPEILKRYLRGESCIHAHANGSLKPHSQEFCATIYGPYHSIGPVSWDVLDFFGLRIECCRESQLDRVRDVCVTGDDQQKFVLIDIVKLMKNGERITFRNGCVVRLRPLNDCLCAFGNSLYYSVVNNTFIVGGDETNRILHPEVCGFVPSQYKRPDEMIESGSQMIQDFAGSDCKFQRGIGWSDNAIDMLLSAVFNVSDELVTVGRKEGCTKSAEFTDIMIGPINLGPTTVEWV
jgi:hypothetical protein